jgi:hypothetical protein
MHANRLNGVLSIVVLVLASFSAIVKAQDVPPRAELVTAFQHGRSRPLREMPPERPAQAQALPVLHPLPESAVSPNDPVVQRTTTTATSSSVFSGGMNFDGISADGWIPPDTNLSVGATQLVQIVNVDLAVFDKQTGTRIYGPTAIHTVFTALGGLCGTRDGGDPIVLYDKMAGRWLISQFEYSGSSSDYMCIAVSQTSDATGAYNLYSYYFGNKFPDYPKFGVWPDGYYFSANIYKNGASFIGAQACAFDRASMLAGQPANSICFQLPSSVASLLPSDLDGSTLPSAGESNFYLRFVSNGLNLYRFHMASYSTPSGSTFSGPFTVSNVAAFTQACSSCVPQPGTSRQLDSLGDRLMFRLAYRNFGAYESLVVNHSVKAGSSSNQTGVRWYEIRNPTGTPTVFQQGTYAPDNTTYRWMGSIAEDKVGDIAVGYSVSAPTAVYPGIRYAGRVPGDAAGTLEGESTIISGSASQTGSYSYRYGDYSSMSIDLSDDCTFWFTTEYIAVGGSFNWNTRIASFTFSSCH